MQGVVTYFHRFRMTVRVRNYDFPVLLHQGTIIDPLGTTLSPAMVVSVQGHWDDGAFHADHIVVLRRSR